MIQNHFPMNPTKVSYLAYILLRYLTMSPTFDYDDVGQQLWLSQKIGRLRPQWFAIRIQSWAKLTCTVDRIEKTKIKKKDPIFKLGMFQNELWLVPFYRLLCHYWSPIFQQRTTGSRFFRIFVFQKMGCRHSSVDSSTPAILPRGQSYKDILSVA